jgi:hypothetical protein
MFSTRNFFRKAETFRPLASLSCMSHSDAVRLGLAELYMLGEEMPVTPAEFERHYFDCAACAAELRALEALAAAVRAVVLDTIA